MRKYWIPAVILLLVTSTSFAVRNTTSSGGGGTGDIEGVTAGNGLTDGGTTGTVTLNVGAGTGISVAADSVSSTLGISIEATEMGDADHGQVSWSHGVATVDAVSDGAIPSGITRDTEWDTAGEINAATTDSDFSIAGHTHEITSIDAFTSAQLATQTTDETGTGGAVFANSPTFVDDVTVGALGSDIQAQILLYSSSGDSTNDVGITLQDGSAGNSAGIVQMYVDDNDDEQFKLDVYANTLTALQILDDGNANSAGTLGYIGIGGIKPTARLDIYEATVTANEDILNIGTSANAVRFNVDEDGDVSMDGNLAMTGEVTTGSTASAGAVYISDGSSNTTKFTTQAQAGDIVYTLPADDGAASTFLQSNGSGTLSWVAGAAGDIEGVTAGTGISGGGTSGTVTVNATLGVSIESTELGDSQDFGDFSTGATGVATLDADVVAAAEMADADHGEVTWASGVATIDAESIALTELSDATITGAETYEVLQYNGTAWVDSAVNFSELVGSLGDTQIADGAVDGGTAGEIADDSITNADINSSAAIVVSKTALTAGDHITLTTNDLDVDDDFLLNTGDVGTGGYDYGGATVEIPNGTAPSIDGVGEVAVDSNSDNSNITHGTLFFHDGSGPRYIPSVAAYPSNDGYALCYDSGTKAFVFEAVATASGLLDLKPQEALVQGALVLDGDVSAGATISSADGGWALLFDQTTDEGAVWQCEMPANYAAQTVYADILYSMASGVTLEVEFEVEVMAVTPGDAADCITPSFDTVNVGSDSVPTGGAGYLDKVTITLTNKDSVAAGDLVFFKLSTDSDDATNDDATGDREVRAVHIRW